MAKDLAARVEALEAEVQNLKDRNEIEQLRFRYHSAVNEKQPDVVTTLFAKDAVIDFAHLGRHSGEEELAAFYHHTLSDLIPFVKQFIHNHIITLEGETASGVSYLEAKPVIDGESYLVAARFDDEYVREAGQWKFKKVTFVPFFMVPLSEGWAGEDKIKMLRD